MFRFVLLCFFCLFVLLLIAMSCHCSVCVRLSHLIKDYLLTYLLRQALRFSFFQLELEVELEQCFFNHFDSCEPQYGPQIDDLHKL